MFWKKIFKPKSVRQPFSKKPMECPFTLFLRESAHQAISEETFANPINETGGGLYGKLFLGKWFLVSRVSGPGPKAMKDFAFFTQDPDFEISNAGQNSLKSLAYMGQWHSHHSLGLPTVSGHDVSTMESTARSTGLPLLAVVASIFRRENPQLRLTATLFLPRGEHIQVPIKIIPDTKTQSDPEPKFLGSSSLTPSPADRRSKDQPVVRAEESMICKIANPAGFRIVGSIESRRDKKERGTGWLV